MVAKRRYKLCTIYDNRPDWCRDYPWNHGNEIFPDCQFLDENKNLRSYEEQLKIKTKEQIELYCAECGKCCMFWEGKEPMQCSALRYVEADERVPLPQVVEWFREKYKGCCGDCPKNTPKN